MVRNGHLLEELDLKLALTEPLTLSQKYRLLDEMYEWAKKMKAFPPKDPLEGLETKIALARALSSV